MRVTLIVLIAQETLQRLEQERPESPLISVSGLDEPAFDYPAKEFLSEILRFRNGVALPADKSENRPPVDFAKLGKRILRLLFIAAEIPARQNDAPACRHETVRKVAASRVVWFHRFLKTLLVLSTLMRKLRREAPKNRRLWSGGSGSSRSDTSEMGGTSCPRNF